MDLFISFVINFFKDIVPTYGILVSVFIFLQIIIIILFMFSKRNVKNKETEPNKSNFIQDPAPYYIFTINFIALIVYVYNYKFSANINLMSTMIGITEIMLFISVYDSIILLFNSKNFFKGKDTKK